MKEFLINKPIEIVLDEIESFLNQHQIKIFDIIDQQKEAYNVGLSISKTIIILFGKPEIGTLLMQKNDWITFDLPSKILLIDKNNKTSLIYREPQNYAGANCLNNEGKDILNKINNIYVKIIKLLNDEI